MGYDLGYFDLETRVLDRDAAEIRVDRACC
jgi:hypothetical protein